MTKTIFAGLFVALLAAGCSTAPTGGNVYRGAGFQLTLPATTHFCTNKPPAPDHGFVALLQSEDCLRSDTLPRIELMVSDMPRRPAERPEDLVGKICFTGKAKTAGFSADGMPVSECIDDGEIGGLPYRQYFLLRKNAGDNAVWSTLIIYVFASHDSLDADANTARTVISGIDWR